MYYDYSAQDFIKVIENKLQYHDEVSFDDLCLYVQALIDDKQLDKANTIIDTLKENTDENKYGRIAQLLVFAYRSHDALSLLFSKKHFTAFDQFVIGKAFLRIGKVKKAKISLGKGFEKCRVEKTASDILNQIKLISNNEKHGSFIETEYAYFVKRGNTLEPGHVVFLKNDPEILSGEHNIDPLIRNRNFIIWKVEENMLYLIPISAKPCRFGYVMKKEDYPNVGKDRWIKDYACATTIDNVISVTDKLNDRDLCNARYNLLKSFYFSNNKNQYMIDYIRENTHEVDQFSIITIYDSDDAIYRNFFITKVEEFNYEGYLLDPNLRYTVFPEPYRISKEKLILEIHHPKDDLVNHFINQIDIEKPKKRILY